MLFYSNSLPLNEQANNTDCLCDLVLKLYVFIGVLVDLVSLHQVGKLKAMVDPGSLPGYIYVRNGS